MDVELSKESNPRLADRAFEVELTCRGRARLFGRRRVRQTSTALLILLRVGWKNGFVVRTTSRGSSKVGTNHRNNSEVKTEGIVEAIVEDEDELTDTYDADSDEVFSVGPVVVRDKTHPAVPMSIEQAVTEMELVGHDFFLFQEVESGAPAVVYRRQGYDYGLIRIESPESAS